MTRRRLPQMVRTPWHKNEGGCWSASFGWRGSSVRVTQRQPGSVFFRVAWLPGRGRSCLSLQTTDRAEAQQRAEAFLDALIRADGAPPPEPLTLGELWTRYQQEAPAYSQNTKRTQGQKRASARRLLAFFRDDKRVPHLTPNDVERFTHARRTGLRVGAQRLGPVRDNAVRHDLAVLRTMVLWATRERRADGSFLLGENPLRGVKLPREQDPHRPVATFDRYLKVRKAVEDLSVTAPQERGRHRWVRLELALVLVEATGRRIGAIRGLRWSDISFDAPSIRWRAEFDKRRRERVIPIPEEFAKELRSFQVRLGGVGEAWLFPCVAKDEPWPREILMQLLVRAEHEAGVEHVHGGGWHMYRRKWATEREDLPLKALMEAGGWKDLQTLVTCYQHPSDESILKVMAHPVKLRERKTGGGA
jgi:integrase